MKNFVAVIAAIIVVTSPTHTHAQKKPPVEIIIISPSLELCMSAQKTAIETLSGRQKGKESWSKEEVKKYLESELPKVSTNDIDRLSDPIWQAINDTIQVMISKPTLEQASGRLSFITDFCLKALNGKRPGSSI